MLDSYQWNKPLYNQAAQCWNHDFYFKCMTSNYLPPSKSLMERISNDFGSFHRFAIEFRKAGNAAFGSGWAWLVHDATTGELFVTHTIGADNPIVLNEYYRPILAMDVWEHAYYLDYQNRRKDYTATFLKALVDWKFVEENLLRVEAEAKVLAKARLDTRIDDETSKREREMLEAEAVIEAARTERLQREAKSAAEAALREQERADVEAAAEAARVEQARIENEVTETAEHEQERLEAEVIEKDNETCEGQEL